VSGRLGSYCGDELARIAHHDQRVCVLDADLADSDGADQFQRRHPDRFFQVGIAEQCMVSMAAGMASCGLRPWVFSFAAFVCYRAYDQIRLCVSAANQPVTIVGSHSGGCTGRNGKTHAAVNDLALMASLPNMSVWSPAGPSDVRLAMRSILADNQPAYVRLPRNPVGDLPGPEEACRWLTPPAPVAMASTGLATHLALRAWQILQDAGLRVGLLHCPKVAPLPGDQVSESLRGVELLFVVEDHQSSRGFGTMLAELQLNAEIVNLGWPQGWLGESGDDEQILESCGLQPSQLAARIMDRVTHK